MNTTLDILITLTFFAPMALLVATNLLTHRSPGPASPAFVARRVTLVPLPPARRAQRANEDRWLEAA